jgi:hypothetical protein
MSNLEINGVCIVSPNSAGPALDDDNDDDNDDDDAMSGNTTSSPIASPLPQFRHCRADCAFATLTATASRGEGAVAHPDDVATAMYLRFG